MVLIAFVFLVPLYWLVLSSFRPADRIFADAGDFVPSCDNARQLHRPLLGRAVRPLVHQLVHPDRRRDHRFAGGDHDGRLPAGTAPVPGPQRHLLLDPGLLHAPFHLLLIPLVLADDRPGVDRHPPRCDPAPLGSSVRSVLHAPVHAEHSSGPARRRPGRRRISKYAVFFRVVVPLVKPALATLAVLFALESWNDLLWPLIVMRSPENLPAHVGNRQPVGRSVPSSLGPHHDVVIAGDRAGRARLPLDAKAIPQRLCPDRHWREVGHSFVGTLAPCDPFGIRSTSHWTGAATIVHSSRTKTYTVTQPRTSRRPMPSSLAG